MIARDSFSKDHIMSIHAENHRDPGLIERSIFAFGLLEALRQVGMDFIFKNNLLRILRNALTASLNRFLSLVIRNP